MNTKPILRCAAALAALAVLACSKDDTAEPGTPDTSGSTTPFTITATMDDAPETRVSATDDGSSKIELKWKTGDKIYVVNSAETGTASAGTLYTFTAQNVSSDGKTASFTCADYPEDATPAFAIHQGQQSYGSSFNPTNVTVLPLEYSSSATSLLNSKQFPLWARYDSETQLLKFKPFNAVLKLTLPEGVSGTLSRVRIGSTDGSEIFYDDSYDITSGEAVRKGSTMSSRIKLPGSSSFTGNTKQFVYLSVSPGTELSGQALEIGLVAGNSVYTATIRGANLEAGKCYPLTLGAAKWTARKIYESGTGAAESPFEMANETNLRALACAVRVGETYYGKYFKLTGDISDIRTSEAEPWLPVGSDECYFGGNFDGNGHTVSGTFYLSDKAGYSLGFFGNIHYFKLSNLTLKGNVIYNGSNSSAIYLGAIVGKYDSSDTITGCTRSDGTTTVNAPNATVYAGGIAGYLYRSSSEMHTCRNECDIAVTGKTNYTYVGALVGYNNGKVYSCSTFLDGLKITVNGTQQNPAKAIGLGNSVNKTEHTD